LYKYVIGANIKNIPTLTTDQMIEVDRLMIEEWGISLIQMMENAGRQFAELARRWMGGTARSRKVIVLCGKGNNGGGGMAAARHLHNWGAQVEAILVGEENELKEVPAQQWRILKKLEIVRLNSELPYADIILDAILGYGAKGNPRPPIADWIRRANDSGRPTLSLDSPSGLDLITGTPGLPCIQAAATLTLALPKMGLLASTAKPYVGDLYLADIGVPPEVYAALGLKITSPLASDALLKLS
jgi:NAD(P)H-hydrate epimerase